MEFVDLLKPEPRRAGYNSEDAGRGRRQGIMKRLPLVRPFERVRLSSKMRDVKGIRSGVAALIMIRLQGMALAGDADVIGSRSITKQCVDYKFHVTIKRVDTVWDLKQINVM